MLSQTLNIQQIIKDLNCSPLFNFSLSSKELFHSNFLAWICKAYPKIMAKVFADYLKNKEYPLEIIQVNREQKHTDLKLKYSHGEELIIENKVKSLPSFSQLKEYSNHHPNSSFLLLSLIEPNFAEFYPEEQKIIIDNQPKPFTWYYLSYSNLAKKFQEAQPEIFGINSYHGQLLAEYIQFIGHLHTLQSLFCIDWDEDPPFYNQNIDKLREIRLHDVMIKFWYFQLMQGLEKRLKEENWEINRNWHDIKIGQVIVDSIMINGKGLFEFKYCIKDKTYCPINGEKIGIPIFLGVQIDDGDFKILCECEFAGDKTKAKKISEQLYRSTEEEKLWFDLSHVPGKAKEYPNRKGKEFNQYYGTFIYRYKRLEDSISVKELIDVIMKYVYRIKDNQKDIETIIEKNW